MKEEKKPEKKKQAKAIDGYYRTRKGDSLFKVAGRRDVYGNSMKWPSLFRLNMGGLSGMGLSDDFEHKELPVGLGLRFVTSDEAAKNLAKLGRKVWVVNVLSSRTSKKIVPAALKLMKNGYRVYISSAVVKGQEWMRLRVGFFGDRPKATAAGKKIMSVLEADDAWVAKLGELELKGFGGY
ncbi:MAG: SPOR domain-containing protein [Deltaproteobacteria bacterium]|nr:SPOR domain-containing protein [Deltaproteobacteria bacterium]